MHMCMSLAESQVCVFWGGGTKTRNTKKEARFRHRSNGLLSTVFLYDSYHLRDLTYDQYKVFFHCFWLSLQVTTWQSFTFFYSSIQEWFHRKTGLIMPFNYWTMLSCGLDYTSLCRLICPLQIMTVIRCIIPWTRWVQIPIQPLIAQSNDELIVQSNDELIAQSNEDKAVSWVWFAQGYK